MAKVIAAVDGSAADRPVLSVARELADLIDASLEAVHVEEGKGAGASAAAAMARVALQTLTGPVAAQLVDLSRETDVFALVMGARATPFGPRPAGHTALAVAAGADCPLVVVPPDCPMPFRLRRVLVPMEAVARTAGAVQDTLRRASSAGLQVLVLHVMDAASVPLFTDQPQYEIDAWVREFQLRYCPPPAEVRVGVRVGNPVEEILAAMAQFEVDMVVLAWSQRLAPGHALLVRSVLERASVPVLLLPIALEPNPGDDSALLSQGGQEPNPLARG